MKKLTIVLLFAFGCFVHAQSLFFGANTASAAPPSVTNPGACAISSGSSRSTNCTPSNGGAIGDVIVATSYIANTSGTPTVAFSSSQCDSYGFQPLIPVNVNGTSSALASTTYACVIASATASAVTVTWTSSTGTSPQLAANVFHASTGWNKPLLDRSNSSVNSSSNNCPTGSAGTTRTAYDYIYATCVSNGTSTFQSLSGFTSLNTSNAIGNYGQLVSATGAQSYTPTIASAKANAGAVAALQLNTGLGCTGCTNVQWNSSSGQTGQYDHITLSSFKAGDTIVYFVVHNNTSGSGTTTMTDNTGLNIWHSCDESVTPAASITVNDIQLQSGYAGACFWSPSALSQNGSITGDPVASDCATSCSFVGGIFGELSGTFNLESGAFTHNSGTTTSGSNNAACGALTTANTNDFILNFVYSLSGGTATAGSSPISFSLPTIATQSNGTPESAVWSSSGSITPHVTLANSGDTYSDMCLALY
jgi:hypothetical protein